MHSVFSPSPIIAAFARGESNPSRDEPNDARDGSNGHNVEEIELVDDEDSAVESDTGTAVNALKRKVQHVSTRQTRVKVVLWMVADHEAKGLKGLFARTVRNFPNDFRGSVYGNCMRTSRWWASRDAIGSIAKSQLEMVSVNSVQPGITKKMMTKAGPGRGRKRAEWVSWLYSGLLEEFDRYRKAGVKFSPALLQQLAKDLIMVSDRPVFNSNFSVGTKRIVDMVTGRWIQRFMEANNVAARAQTGKLTVSPERLEHIEKLIAFHLGSVGRT